VDWPAPTRVVLGNLEPILGLGLAAVLTEAGIDVVARERVATKIVSEVGRLLPDVVVLDRDDSASRTLSARVRRVSPHTKVILWARDESLMEVLDPGSEATRLVWATVPEDLRREVAAGRTSLGNRVEE
jgi:AmiR/NasT family two-component response regulator